MTNRITHNPYRPFRSEHPVPPILAFDITMRVYFHPVPLQPPPPHWVAEELTRTNNGRANQNSSISNTPTLFHRSLPPPYPYLYFSSFDEGFHRARRLTEQPTPDFRSRFIQIVSSMIEYYHQLPFENQQSEQFNYLRSLGSTINIQRFCPHLQNIKTYLRPRVEQEIRNILPHLNQPISEENLETLLVAAGDCKSVTLITELYETYATTNSSKVLAICLRSLRRCIQEIDHLPTEKQFQESLKKMTQHSRRILSIPHQLDRETEEQLILLHHKSNQSYPSSSTLPSQINELRSLFQPSNL